MMETKDTSGTAKEVVIEAKGLKKSFGNRSVLNGVDIYLRRGENLAVLGKSGTGKSVLIKIISGLLKPDDGTICVLGQEVDKLDLTDLRKLRQKIGFSFQNSALYDSMSVRENLEFPLIRNRPKIKRQEVNDAVVKVLNDVGLSKTIDQMPAELSGGQRKRIGIARTLILQPEIMLYDEPTSGLDPITSIEINNLINQVQKEYNTTSLIITHDLTCAKMTADNVTMLVEGKFLPPAGFSEFFQRKDESVKTFYDYNFINEK